MYKEISGLILFRPAQDSILMHIASAIQRVEQGMNDADITYEVYGQISRLVELSGELGLEGNLWHNYLTHFLLTDENPFTLNRERISTEEDTLSTFALNDFEIFRKLFRYDFSLMESSLGIDCFELIFDFKVSAHRKNLASDDMGRIMEGLVTELAAAESAVDFYKILSRHYSVFGVGMLGLNRSFRLDTSEGKAALKSIYNADKVMLSDLVGYELQKRELVRNTKAFVEGKPANNVLLYGDSGSGKSTSIKAIINEFYDRGLRLIEIYKHQFKHLSEVISAVKNRNYKFIIFIDDLSFEDFEVEYKFLKAVIEGGVEVKPDNVLIYATSNRRHLIKETWNDRSDMTHSNEIHHSDTLEEKLSLASRFGVSINYSSPTRKEYHDIIKTLAQRNGIVMEEQELLKQADTWEIRHGGISGRTAQQFINYLVCGR